MNLVVLIFYSGLQIDNIKNFATAIKPRKSVQLVLGLAHTLALSYKGFDEKCLINSSECI